METLRKISKTALIASHAKTRSWHDTFLKFKIRDVVGYDIAHKLGIDTSIKAKRKIPLKGVRKPLTKIAKRVWKVVTPLRKLRIARRISRVPWFKTRRPTKKGWSLVYRYQVGTGSPPYQPGEYRWKQECHFIHSNPKKPRLDMEIARLREKTNPDVKKSWFKLVWLDKDADK